MEEVQEVEVEEQVMPVASKIQEIKDKEPGKEFYFVGYAGLGIVYCALDRVAYASVRTKIQGDADAMEDDDAVNMALIKECVRYPSIDELEKHFESKAGLVSSLSSNIQLVSGFEPVQPPVKL